MADRTTISLPKSLAQALILLAKDGERKYEDVIRRLASEALKEPD